METYRDDLTTEERLKQLRMALDSRAMITTARSINEQNRGQRLSRSERRAQRQWQRQQVGQAVDVGRKMGLLPGQWTIAWMIMKFVIEAAIRRWMFSE